jgi:hypothetical protein
MSMIPEQENFESLRKLLAFKRHEQPPPGYFNHFSSRVIERIKAGERGDSPLERLSWDVSWLRKLWAMLDARPILAGAVGAGACGLLIAGVMYSERADLTDITALPTPETAHPVQIVDGGTAQKAQILEQIGLPDPSGTDGAVGSPARSSLFQEINEAKKAWVVPVNLNSTPNGGN